MAWFKGRIARRLAASLLTVTLLTTAMAVVMIYMVRYISADFTGALTRTNMASAGDKIRLESQQLVYLTHIYTSPDTDNVERAQLRLEMTAHRARADMAIEQAVGLTSFGDLDERKRLANIQERVVNLSLQINRLLEAYDKEGEVGPETRLQRDILVRDYEGPLTQEIESFQEYEASHVQEVQNEAKRMVGSIWAIVALVAYIVLAITCVTIYWGFRRIVLPLGGLHAGVERLRQGDLDQKLRVEGQDEISELAAAFNSMAAQLKHTLQGLHENVAELRQTQQELAISEQHYRSLFDGVPLGLFRSTPEGRILDANEAIVDLLGYPSRQALLEIDAHDVYGDREDRTHIQEALEEDGKTHPFEIRMRRPNGDEFWARENSRAVYDDEGKLSYFEGSLEDITPMKEAEEYIQCLNAELEQRVLERTAQLEAAIRELEAFSYSVSHDLRAPLRALDGYSKLLLEDYSAILDETGKEYLRRVRQSSQRMGKLIDDLLNLSRITRREMQRSPVNLSELAKTIADELHKQNPERVAEFVISEGVTAEGDASLLYIVLDNLLGNAWKFTARHERARIEFGLSDLRGQPVYFVSDDGSGFDMTYAHKLFGAFQRLHSIEEFEGTGIGLATAQRIIRRHGGEIWAEAAVERGATFYFTLEPRSVNGSLDYDVKDEPAKRG
jgi:PAS domain S-box-containing protein